MIEHEREATITVATSALVHALEEALRAEVCLPEDACRRWDRVQMWADRAFTFARVRVPDDEDET